MIEINNVSKWFLVRKGFLNQAKASKTLALDSINLKIEENQILAIVGPNGAGKTTLLKLICGLLLPDKGEVKMPNSIGYLSSEALGFYPQLSARQNLEFIAALYNFTPEIFAQRLNKYSEKLNIDNLDKPFWTYSTGLKNRLCLLRILLLGNQLIIMDEPTKSLDKNATQDFWNYFKTAVDEFSKTVIFATHSLSQAQSFASKVIVMNKAKIVKEVDDLNRNQNLIEIYQTALNQ